MPEQTRIKCNYGCGTLTKLIAKSYHSHTATVSASIVTDRVEVVSCVAGFLARDR